MKKLLLLCLLLGAIALVVLLERRQRAPLPAVAPVAVQAPKSATPVPAATLDPEAASAALATSTVIAATGALATSTTAATISAAPPTQKPEVAIEDGKTIDFSSGDAVISANDREKAKLERSLKDIDAAAESVTFTPRRPGDATKKAPGQP